MTNHQKQTFARVVRAIVETIAECGERGAPSGPLYVAMMSQGMSLDTYQRIMAVIVDVGYATEKAHCYYITEKGRAWLA